MTDQLFEGYFVYPVRGRDAIRVNRIGPVPQSSSQY